MYINNKLFSRTKCNVRLAFCLCGVIGLMAGCKKLVQAPAPTTSIAADDVYLSDATAAAVLTGIYQKIGSLATNNAGSVSSLTLFNGLSADEFTLWNGVTNLPAIAHYQNQLSGTTGANYGSEYWTVFYQYLFTCNDAIAGLTASTSLSQAVKQQALGEAEFMRAFFYFYLVNLYDNIPLVLSNNYKINAGLPQAPKTQVYQQIVADLQNAQPLLSTSYVDGTLVNPTADRVRPTKWAADALLARVYLYLNNWGGADSAASILINNTSLFGLSSLSNTFLRASLGNNEAIWQLQPVSIAGTTNTWDAYYFIIGPNGPGKTPNFGAYLSASLINSFEPNDLRLSNWIGNTTFGGVKYYYPYKYKLTTGAVKEHFMLLRLAEQYLIRAEARVHEGNINGAQADLNKIRARAGLPATTDSTQAALLADILHERRVELFAELGHRWLDLKRTGAIDSTMTAADPQKNNSTWQSYQQLFPISPTDILYDPSLRQNPGY